MDATLGKMLIASGKKIVAVARNYPKHAAEMGAEIPSHPSIFIKPLSSIVREPHPIQIPSYVTNVHHEIELGVVIGKKGKDIPIDKWETFVAGYVLGLDMTARDLQSIAKQKGLPWTESKCFDTFTPLSKFVHKEKIRDYRNLSMWLKVNQIQRQCDSPKNMLFDIPTLLSYISARMTLTEGDIVLTGTPEGVGPVVSGDVISAGLENDGRRLIEMSFPVEKHE